MGPQGGDLMSNPPVLSIASSSSLTAQLSSTNLQLGLLRRSSRTALVLVGAAAPKEFINFLITEKFGSKIDSDRVGALKLVSHIVKRRPLILYDYLDRIIENILRSLDPTLGATSRDALLQPTTVTLRGTCANFATDE